MVSVMDARIVNAQAPRSARWSGRSGRTYLLDAIRLENLSLEGADLYILARGSLVLWAGSSADVVDDPQSRARFRLALTCADRAFRVADCEDAVARMTIVWDLEGASPALQLSAA